MSKGTVLKGPPKGWKRLLLRLPIALYNWRCGWILGRRFLLLNHIGRKTKVSRLTVLEVVRYDEVAGAYTVASGWGEKAQWFRNILHNPEVEITVRNQRQQALARRVNRTEAEHVLRDYARRHPAAMRQLAQFMVGQEFGGSDEDFRLLAENVPLVELRLRD